MPTVRPSPVRTSSTASAGTARSACSTRRARWGWSSFATIRAPRSPATAASSAALPPGPAHRSSQRASGPSSGASVRASATSWLPSSCTPARPSRTLGSAAGSPPVRITPVGVSAPNRPAPSVSSSTASWSTRPGRATRVTRGAALSAVRSAPISSADRPLPTRASRSARTTQSGWLCVTDSRASSSSPAASAIRCSHSSEVVLPTVRRTALTNCDGPVPSCSRASPTVSETAACAGTRMPRSWWTPSRRTSSAGASIVETSRAAAWAMTASYRPRNRRVP